MQTLLQHIIPHKLISLIAGLCADCKIIWIKNFLIGYFIKRYAVDMQEASKENPFDYPSYNDFFTRELKPTARPIDQNSNSIVSPADGIIAQIGNISGTNIIQAKQHSYSLPALCGGDLEVANDFIDGSFATVYLAPHNYHRVHMPVNGTLQKMIYVPGKLFSVNAHAAENIPNLFARNERVISIFATEVGPVAVIMVGAMIVGSIETVWQGLITPPHTSNVNTWEYAGNTELDKGMELGRFKLGSTVIILFMKDAARWLDSLLPGAAVVMGQKIGETHEI